MHLAIIRRLDCSEAGQMSQESPDLLPSRCHEGKFAFAKARRTFVLDP